MKSIDLFCGAGGLSLGLEAAGFQTALAVELNSDACRTYHTRFPHADLLDTDICKVDFRPWRNRVDLVAGGPPCQPFSSGGKGLAEDDERNMVPQFIRAVEEIQPPLFLMENVPGLVGRDYFDSVVDHMRTMCDAAYTVTWQIVFAADYGVPQKRLRLMVVGSRIGAFQFPLPTHGPNADKPYETAGKYLSKTEILGTPNPSRINYAKNPDIRPSPYDGHLFNGGGRAINLDSPCPTILASAGGNKTHFVDTMDEVPRYHAELMAGKAPRTGELPGARRLTVEESAMIQTFPTGARFYGSRSAQYTQVGNAVPPRLATSIGTALARLLDGVNRETLAG